MVSVASAGCTTLVGRAHLLCLHHGESLARVIHGRHQRPRAARGWAQAQPDPGLHEQVPHHAAGLLRGVWRCSGRHRSRKAAQGLGSLTKDAVRARREGSAGPERSEEHTSELQSLAYLVCRLLLEKKKKKKKNQKRINVK